MDSRPLYERVLVKVERAPGECWIFRGALAKGYGRVNSRGRLHQAHRVVYEALVGPIPEGLTLDHLCFQRACVNPEHMEPVTRGENSRRGAARREPTLTCPSGHPKVGENLYLSPSGGRFCRECGRAANARLYARQKAARASR